MIEQIVKNQLDTADETDVMAATIYLDPQEDYGSLSQFVCELIDSTEGRIQNWSLNKKLCAISLIANKKAILDISKNQYVIKVTR